MLNNSWKGFFLKEKGKKKVSVGKTWNQTSNTM
jgi:hypothetical protein